MSVESEAIPTLDDAVTSGPEVSECQTEKSDQKDIPEAAHFDARDKSILDFEAKYWKKTAVKERAIVEELGISPLEYYQRLSVLVKVPAAAHYAPHVVGKLLEFRRARTRKPMI
ncbi:DUF3263 domain-containing protein [Timonella sp. A28]|uniref:DUF3263 domain-containing protein n=1 Tax=Timonella sp. A28 TaxID=3442640 RepID=UPI003EC0EFE4